MGWMSVCRCECKLFGMMEFECVVFSTSTYCTYLPYIPSPSPHTPITYHINMISLRLPLHLVRSNITLMNELQQYASESKLDYYQNPMIFSVSIVANIKLLISSNPDRPMLQHYYVRKTRTVYWRIVKNYILLRLSSSIASMFRLLIKYRWLLLLPFMRTYLFYEQTKQI